MRYIIFVLSFFIGSIQLSGQINQPGIRPSQISAGPLIDSVLYLLGTDTTGTKIGLGKFYRADSLGLGGDTDWYKLGGTLIPTNSDSAYRTGYLLLEGLDGGIDTKIEMLKNGVINFDKTGLYNTPTYLFSVNPFQSGANVGRMGMVAYASDNTYGGKKNQVFAFGINPIDADNSATGLYFSFEDYYRPSAPSAYSELHLLFNDSTDVDRRLWTWFINKSDPTAWQVAYYTDQFIIRDPRALTGDSTYFKIEQVDGVQSQLLLLGANNSVSGGSKGVGQLVHTANNTFEIYPYGSMPSSSEFYTRQFNVTNVNRLRIENDFGTTNGSSGLATSIIGREGSYGGVVGIGNGWGWDLISGALVIDSSQVSTPYDLTTDPTWYEVGTSRRPDANTDDIFKSSGKVGIGEATPANRLEVVASSASNDEAIIRLSGGDSGFSGANESDQEHSILFDACAFNGSAISQQSAGEIGMKKEGSWNEAANGVPGIKSALTFKTQNGTVASPSLTEKMRIASTGQITLNEYTTSNFNGGVAADSVLVVTSVGVVKKRNAAAFGGSGATDLIIGGAGPYTIESSTGTDVTVDDLFGIVLSEPTANTLAIKADTSVLATQYDITQVPINYIKAATASNTAAHANYAQEWTWNSLNTSGLKLSSTSTAASSTNHKLFEISTTGINASSGATTYGAYLSNTHSGTTSTNYGLYSAASGAASTNYAIYGEANGSNGYGVTGISASNVGVLGAGAIGVYGSANSGIGVYSTATSGLALSGNATSGTGLEAIVTSGIPISVQDNSAGTNTVEPMIQMYHLTTGTAAAGIGSSIVYNTEASDGADYVSNRLKSIWTTATAGSRVSSFIFSGVNAATEADILTLKGSKQLQFHGYGTGGAFTASPVADLFVDATGNVVQGSMTGQSWTADADDATTPTLISNQTLKIAGASGITTDLFDNVSTDSITIAVNGKEFTKVTALQSDDFLLLHDSISQTNERILWSDVIIDLISFKDGNSSVGTGNAIDVGEGLDISMSPSTEANINLDASEFLLDGTNETDESFLVYDPDTTAGHRIQRIPWSDVVGGSDTNWAEDDLTVTGNRLHDMAGFFVTYTGTAMQTYFQNEAIAGNTGNTLVLVSEAGASGTGIVGGISYQSENSGSPTEMYDIQAEKWSSTRSTLTFSGEQSSDAEISYEKNADLSDNTTESHISINGGVAFTQNYDYSTAADLELDRSYHILNVTGGAATDTIKLPEVAQSTDNWSSSLSATQVQVGQEYVITNFRSATNLVVAAYNPTSGNSDLINSQTNITTYSAIIMPANTSLKFRCVRLASGVGYWYTY